VAKRSQQKAAPIEVLERGEVAFLATPRVRSRDLIDDAPPPHPREVQRLYLLLSAGREAALPSRPRRQEPVAGRLRQRFWACVDRVGSSIEEVAGDLGEFEYETKTRGPRRQPPARALAEGTYALVRHGDHTHFTYRVHDPCAPAEVLRALRIEPQASYVVAAFNPSAPPRLALRIGGSTRTPRTGSSPSSARSASRHSISTSSMRKASRSCS